MKIYTKTGDEGMTGLFAGPRVSKSDRRICAYGTVDELNAVLGAAQAHAMPEILAPMITEIQADLFSVGAELATPDPDGASMRLLGESEIAKLESWIDRFEEQLPPLRQFILPGGTSAAAMLHWARTVCRRAEREVVFLAEEPMVADCSTVIKYLNRLSDLLFVMARTANFVVGKQDVAWHRPRTE